jgi:hypothetical protein
MTFSERSLQGAMSRVGTVDHRLARRHLINEYHRGRLRRDQVCDAHPELMRAARQLGTPTTTACPICAEDHLVLVTYVFGPRLPKHGRCVTTRAELERFKRSREHFTAYLVEACRSCAWHHLLRVVPLTSTVGQRAASH